MSRGTSRTTAEWVTFGVAAAVLLVVLALIGSQLIGERTAASPVATVVGEERVVAGQHYVDVEVENRGDQTAANVQVSAELEIDGQTTGGDQTIDFLAGHEVERLVFVFTDSVEDGRLEVAVTGFGVP